MRGGILDILTGAENPPTRVEFFGDEVDRISVFDIESQRTVAEGESLNIFPALEVIIDKAAAGRIIREIDRLLPDAPDDISREKLMRESHC